VDVGFGGVEFIGEIGHDDRRLREQQSLNLAREHVTSRQAFGSSLSALDSVQQLLGEAAMRAAGLQLLLGVPAAASSLAYAIEAVNDVCATCQQVTGAIGYTMEFPLQRRYRRASAISVWSRGWLQCLPDEHPGAADG
jgi:alkylation response protein AidB-like acyl-CoA dehydrogenase